MVKLNIITIIKFQFLQLILQDVNFYSIWESETIYILLDLIIFYQEPDIQMISEFINMLIHNVKSTPGDKTKDNDLISGTQ